MLVAGSWLETTSAWIGIILAVPVIWTWWEVLFGRRRRHRRWYARAKSDEGQRPAVLVVDLLPRQDMLPSVSRYLQKSGIPLAAGEQNIFHVHRNDVLSDKDVPALMEDVRNTIEGMSKYGPDVVHLFFGGPTGAALKVGAALGNFGRVQVYQFNVRSPDAQDYEAWGPLRHPL